MNNSGIKINTTTDLVTEECCNCHVLFAFPAEMRQRCIDTGESFYCPNGHCQSYTESTVTKLRHKLDQREAELQSTYDRLNGALKDVTNKKRQITKLKNRVKNGVCTECHRHFDDLEEHMKSCHGTLAEKEAVKKRHQR